MKLLLPSRRCCCWFLLSWLLRISRRRSRVGVVLLLLGPGPLFAQQAGFPCDGRFFLSGSDGQTGGSYVLQAYPKDIGPTFVWQPQLITADHHLGPMGFSVWDQYLYALDTLTWEIVRIDSNYQTTVVGSIADDIDTTLQFRAGAINPPGFRFILVGHDRSTGTDKLLYTVRLDRADLQVGTNSLVTQAQLRMTDLAFDPLFGVLFGFDAVNRRLVQLVGGLATGYSFQSAPVGVTMQGLFFSREGTLFGYGSSPGTQGAANQLYQFNRSTGVATPVKQVAGTQVADACSCPYEIELTRRFSPQEALPCDTITLSYRIRNHSGFTYRTLKLRDTLPAGLTLTSLVHKPPLAVVSQAGPDRLQVDFSDLPMGLDSVVFRVAIDAGTQLSVWPPARLDSFPDGIGPVIFSSDEAGNELTLTALSVDLGPDRSACFGTSITLIPTISGGGANLSYLWSDGSTQPSLAVSNSGLYAVTVSNGCLSGTDSVQVDLPGGPFQINAGSNRNLDEGSAWFLSVTVDNGVGPLSYVWEAPTSAGLSCKTCASPLAYPSEDVTLLVTVTDENGCQAIDSIRLEVFKIRDVQAPNVFTPNGDGLHDTFFLVGEANGRVLQLQIFDRWGRMVFDGQGLSLNDATAGWDGRLGSQLLPPGVYYWSAEVEYADGSRETFRHHVTLLR